MTNATKPINTAGDTLGAALNVSDFIRPGFTVTFPTIPAWHVGKVNPLAAGATAPALTDPSFYLTAGYIHNTPSPSDPSYAKPGAPFPGFSWLSDELAPYPNGDAIAATGCNPFSVAADVLTISAIPTPASVLPWLPAGFSQSYVSGAMCSFPFSQTYGYFEAKMKVPTGQGLWPAFWLMPVDMSSPPENDIVEVIGSTPDVLYTTLHDTSYATATNTSTQISYGTNTVDLSQGFHLFGCDWGPETVRYYLDRVLVFSEPTPADWNKPFYWIVNLAVGGPTSWPGAPDASTAFPAKLEVAYVSVWQREAYV